MKRIKRNLTTYKPKNVAILFSGQGSQLVGTMTLDLGMGSDIYEKYAVAREVLDTAEEILQFNIKKLMFQGPQVKIINSRI